MELRDKMNPVSMKDETFAKVELKGTDVELVKCQADIFRLITDIVKWDVDKGFDGKKIILIPDTEGEEWSLHYDSYPAKRLEVTKGSTRIVFSPEVSRRFEKDPSTGFPLNELTIYIEDRSKKPVMVDRYELDRSTRYEEVIDKMGFTVRIIFDDKKREVKFYQSYGHVAGKGMPSYGYTGAEDQRNIRVGSTEFGLREVDRAIALANEVFEKAKVFYDKRDEDRALSR